MKFFYVGNIYYFGGHMNNFLKWNQILLETFFNPQNDGERVFLYLNREIVDDIGYHLGGFDNLVECIKKGPPQSMRLPILLFSDKYDVNCFVDDCTKLASLRNQKTLVEKYDNPSTDVDYLDVSDHAPSYLPYIAFLIVMCSETNTKSFYKTVRNKLSIDLNVNFNTACLRLIINYAFNDLQRWTKEECDGKFGIFQNMQLGHLNQLGWLKSQCLFCERDLPKIERFFAAQGYVAGGHFSPAQLQQSLASFQTERLQFAAQLRNALAPKNIDKFRDIISEIIKSTYEDWDGTTQYSSHCVGTRKLGIVLRRVMNASFELGLDIPYTGTTGELTITNNEVGTWSGSFGRLNSTFVYNKVQYLSLLNGKQHQFEVEGQNWNGKFTYQDVYFLSRDTMNRNIFTEVVSLPSHGGAFALVKNSIFENIDDGLYTTIHITGIPQDWGFVYIQDVSQILEFLPSVSNQIQQRETVLTFEDGVSIRRGGKKLYLPNFLPILSVDYNGDFEIQAEGMEFHEIKYQNLDEDNINSEDIIDQIDILANQRTRYFEMNIIDASKVRFTIEIVSSDSEDVIASKILKISSQTTLISYKDLFFDNRGCLIPAERLHELGNSIFRGSECKNTLDENIANDCNFKYRNGFEDFARNVQCDLNTPIIDLLDTLAQVRQMNTQKAKMILGETYSKKIYTILNILQSRGFLEIQTDNRGRWVRLLAIPASIYRLPITRRENETIEYWSMSGTLRKSHWEQLQDSDIATMCKYETTTNVPIIRLEGSIEMMDERFTDFQILDYYPSYRIANMCSTLDDMKEHQMKISLEGRSEDRNDELYFDHGSVTWTYTQNIAEGEHISWKLQQFTDPQTRVHKIHQLSFKSPQYEHVKYSFLQDRNWGIWMVFQDCRALNIQNILPLTYERLKGILWIPKRLDFPFVLKRALVLASGKNPVEAKFRLHHKAKVSLDMISHDGKYVLRDIDPVYLSMIPPDHDRRWVGYENVPRALVEIIRQKLKGYIGNCERELVAPINQMEEV
jgi:hypothetical protein